MRRIRDGLRNDENKEPKKENRFCGETETGLSAGLGKSSRGKTKKKRRIKLSQSKLFQKHMVLQQSRSNNEPK